MIKHSALIGSIILSVTFVVLRSRRTNVPQEVNKCPSREVGTPPWDEAADSSARTTHLGSAAKKKMFIFQLGAGSCGGSIRLCSQLWAQPICPTQGKGTRQENLPGPGNCPRRQTWSWERAQGQGGQTLRSKPGVCSQSSQ